jgi:NTP pyrophosphatase (non-canonical NTP hydrolase)
MEFRPIDANALKKQLSALNSYDSVLQAVARIDAAPTLRCEECPNYDAAFDCRSSCENCERTLTLNPLRDEIYEDAVAHGLWKQAEDGMAFAFDPDAHGCEEDFRRKICVDLIAAEVQEFDDASYFEDDYAEELADVIIMSMSVAGYLGIDIDAAIRRKMEINRGRPWKHGKE